MIAITPETPVYYGAARGPWTDPSNLLIRVLPAGGATLVTQSTPGGTPLPVRVVHGDVLDIAGVGRFRVHCPPNWAHTPALHTA